MEVFRLVLHSGHPHLLFSCDGFVSELNPADWDAAEEWLEVEFVEP